MAPLRGLACARGNSSPSSPRAPCDPPNASGWGRSASSVGNRICDLSGGCTRGFAKICAHDFSPDWFFAMRAGISNAPRLFATRDTNGPRARTQ